MLTASNGDIAIVFVEMLSQEMLAKEFLDPATTPVRIGSRVWLQAYLSDETWANQHFLLLDEHFMPRYSVVAYRSAGEFVIEMSIFWPFVLCGAGLMWGISGRRRRYRLRNNLCGECGYCLEGLVETRCPECGKESP
jgi:hypothetical protein